MPRPLPHGCALLVLALAVAAPAHAQRERVIRQAFAPAITPFLGATLFGERTTATADGSRYDYANGIAFGVQLDRPLTRRTGVLATISVTPLSRVTGTEGISFIDFDRTVVAGLDLGLAGRLKPGAPLFVYAGGGAVLATNNAVREPDGFEVDPRGTLGVGIDLMRRERTGFRLLYLAHWVKPSSPDDAQWVAKSTAIDHTFVIGGRLMLGYGRTTP